MRDAARNPQAAFPSQKYELILFYSRKKTRIPTKTGFSGCFFVFLFDIQIYCPIFVAPPKGERVKIEFEHPFSGFRWLPCGGESGYII